MDTVTEAPTVEVMPPPAEPKPWEAIPDGDFAIVELFGHTTLVGRITEVEQFGAKMLLVANNAEVERRRAAEAANDFRPDSAGRVWVRDSVDFFTTLPDGRPRFATIMPGEVG